MGKTTGTIALNQQDPHHGDVIDFAVETNADYPHVLLNITQNGAAVSTAQQPYWHDDPATKQFTLDAPGWTGGGHAVATLIDTDEQGRHGKEIAETEFEILA